ncbi:MAG: efflux RND transporter periplasmic adaptor subunit [Myxococcales bacterium]|nr:efflux RND transporter periplasmic adaptor subunit [Myxococcales bacterium]
MDYSLEMQPDRPLQFRDSTEPARADAPSAPPKPADDDDRPAGGNEAHAAKPGGGRKRKRVLLAVAIVVLAVGAYSGVRYYEFASTHETTDNAQVEGHIAPVIPHVTGYVAKVLVDDNQEVSAGEVLVRMDTADLDLEVQGAQDAVKSAQTAVTSAEAALDNATAQRKAVEAAVTAAQIESRHADRERARQRALFRGNATTRQALDDATSAASAKAAELDVAKQHVAVAVAGIARGEAALAEAKAHVSSAETRLAEALRDRGYAEVKAPIDGHVVKKSVEPGQLVQAGQPLMAVAEDSTAWVEANFKEKQIAKIAVGQTATLEVDAYEDHPFHGRVDSLAAATGSALTLLPPDDASGNFVKVQRWIPVKLLVTDPDPTRPLRPGMNVTVEVRTAPAR